MPHSFEEVRQIASQLPADQRVLLANSLWESVDNSSEDAAGVEAAWDSEVLLRLNAIDSGTVEMVPLDDVLARMDARLLAKQRG
jgi:putative addiction module component (TIGR02574 family)